MSLNTWLDEAMAIRQARGRQERALKDLVRSQAVVWLERGRMIPAKVKIERVGYGADRAYVRRVDNEKAYWVNVDFLKEFRP